MMTKREMIHHIPLDDLRDRISVALAAHVKSYNIPGVCTGLGLESGESDEAHRSKRIYVKNRLLGLKEPELLQIATGVTGAPKNLIFASIKAKPGQYFTDAINNDITIRNNTDALIYDRFLGDSGLLWSTMAEWWQENEGLNVPKKAQQALYKRLLLSVREAASPREYTLFDTYYREFPRSTPGAHSPGLFTL